MCGCGTEEAHLKERYFKYTEVVPFVINIICFLMNYGCSQLPKLSVTIMDSCPSLTPTNCRL